MIQRLRRAISHDMPSQAAFHECRQCGTVVGDAVRRCPTCDSTEIAHYEL